jgi:hypothetical protein
LAEQLCFLLVSRVLYVTCNYDHFTAPLALCGFILFFVYIHNHAMCLVHALWWLLFLYYFICFINHDIMDMILIIIYYFDMKFLLIVWLNGHYGFVQHCSSLAIILFLFCINKNFLLWSHILNKCSSSHIYWPTIQCKEYSFGFSFYFLLIIIFSIVVHALWVLWLALSFDN